MLQKITESSRYASPTNDCSTLDAINQSTIDFSIVKAILQLSKEGGKARKEIAN